MKSPAVHTPLLSLIASAFLTAVGFAAEPLVTLHDCKFIPTDWADGDSFEIQAVDGGRMNMSIPPARRFWEASVPGSALHSATLRCVLRLPLRLPKIESPPLHP